MSKIHGDTYRIQLPHKIVVISKNVELLAEVSNSLNFGKADEYRFYEPWLGQSSIISSGPQWKRLRKIIQPAYHFQIIEHSMPVFQEQANILVASISQLSGKGINISPILASYALAVILQVTMDIKCETKTKKVSDAHRQYINASEQILRVIDQRILNPLSYFDWFWQWTAGYRKQSELIDVLHNFVDDVVANKRILKLKQQEDNNNEIETNEEQTVPTLKRKVLLDLLFSANVHGQLTEREIRDELNTATFAGHSSTTITSGFLLYCLARHQDVQSRVYDEIMEMLPNSDDEISIQDINRLRYLDMALKESMRIYTLAPIAGRRGIVDFTFQGKKIPANTTIYFLVNSIHMNPEYYPEPHKYDPERFLPEVASKRHPFTYVPFAAGLRRCAGNTNLDYVEVYIYLFIYLFEELGIRLC